MNLSVNEAAPPTPVGVGGGGWFNSLKRIRRIGKSPPPPAAPPTSPASAVSSLSSARSLSNLKRDDCTASLTSCKSTPQLPSAPATPSTGYTRRAGTGTWAIRWHIKKSSTNLATGWQFENGAKKLSPPTTTPPTTPKSLDCVQFESAAAPAFCTLPRKRTNTFTSLFRTKDDDAGVGGVALGVPPKSAPPMARKRSTVWYHCSESDLRATVR